MRLLYDGTYEGFLTGVFEAFVHKGASLCAKEEAEPSFYEEAEVETDETKARRVVNGITAKLGQETAHTVESAWLTHQPGIEDALVLYLKRCFSEGRDVAADRTDPAVCTVVKAAFRAQRETQKFEGFVRFRPVGRMYLSDINPTADLLPLLAEHFTDRFMGTPFVIRDRTHNRALLYDGQRWCIAQFERFEDPDLVRADAFEEMWKRYYKAMAIEARKNPKLRRQFMPKKYWEHLPEVRDLL